MQRLWGIGVKACQALVIVGMTVTMSSGVSAQSALTPRPLGRGSIDQAQLAFIGNAAVGGGTLFYRGRSYPFTINGVGGTGASKIKATGEVYQLTRVSDLEGVHGQVRLGGALANQGDGQLWMQNDKDFVLRLRTKREGLMLVAGADAVRIQLR